MLYQDLRVLEDTQSHSLSICHFPLSLLACQPVFGNEAGFSLQCRIHNQPQQRLPSRLTLAWAALNHNGVGACLGCLLTALHRNKYYL